MTKLADRVNNLEQRASAVDPGLAQIMSTDTTPAAAPTNAPNRLTFWVPQFETMLSLGQEDTETWDTDVGIVGRTQPNVYQETRDAPKTAFSLGTAGKGTEFIKAVGDTGYVMRTEKHAFHYADFLQYYITTGGDMSAGADAGSAVMQADGGTVEINAGNTVSLNGTSQVILCAKDFDLFDLDYAKDASTVAFTHQTEPESTLAEDAGGWADKTQSCVDLLAGFVPGVCGNHMAPGTEPWKPGWVAQGVGAVKIAASFYSGPNSVSFKAANDIGMGATVAGMIGGLIGAGVTGSFASAMGTVVQAVGLAYSCVWGGIMADMSSKSVFVTCEGGSVGFTSMLNTSVAGKDSVRMHAQGDIQLNAGNAGHAVAYGAKMYVGAASAYGLVAKAGEVAWGAVSSATDFGSVAAKEDGVMKLTDSELLARYGADMQLELSGSKAELKHKKSSVTFDAMGLTAVGKKTVEFKAG